MTLQEQNSMVLSRSQCRFFHQAFLGISALLATCTAQAQWVQSYSDLDTRSLHSFTMPVISNSAQAVEPYGPPVVAVQDESELVLQGVTTYGREKLDGELTSGGLSYRLDLSTTGEKISFQSWAMPTETGKAFTHLLDVGNGRFIGSSYYNYFNNSSYTTTTQLFELSNGQVNMISPTNTEFDGSKGGYGQHATDSEGNIYYGTTSAGTLIQRSPEGIHTTLFTFTKSGSGTSAAYLLGAQPTLLFWSDYDDYLYIGSRITSSTNGANYPGVDASAKVYGALLRIPGSALRLRTVNESDIELLHYFTQQYSVYNTTEHLSSMIEDESWLYGSGVGIWRFNRDQPKAGVVMLNFETDLSAVYTVEAPNLAGGPSGLIEGPIALAVDGNIYGTTVADASITTQNSKGVISASGKGALFRVVTGNQVDRSDDRIEVLRYFNDNTLGHTPWGLRAGPIINGEQWLLGATKGGGDSSDSSECTTECTAGKVYALTVDIPEITFNTPLTPYEESYQVGETPSLRWSTNGADQCEASGDWSGVQPTSGTARAPALTEAGTVNYTLTCTSLVGASLSSSTSVVVTEVNTATVTRPTQEQHVDGGGGFAPPILLALTVLGMLVVRRRI
jgi:hypothetical protein